MEYKYVYFIESHEKKESVKLHFSKNYTEFQDLKIVENIENELNYDISIYRFKIYPQRIKKNKFEILIKLEDNDNKFEKAITNIDLNINNYLFDFKFEVKGVLFKKNPPKSLDLTLQNQFNYYSNYLNKKGLNKNDLVTSIQKILEHMQEYDIFTYLTIFIDSFSPDTMQRHLDLFKQEYIKGKVDINDNTFTLIKVYLNSLENDPYQMIKHLNKEKEEENKIQLFSIIFYFNYIFNKKRIQEMINNEKINEYIYKGICKYGILFGGISLTNQQIQEMINYVTSFDELISVFKYNPNVLDLLKIINDNTNTIIDLYESALEEYNKSKDKYQKYPCINFEKLVCPYKDDNISEISDIIQNIYSIIDQIQPEYKDLLFFSPSFFKSYIELYDYVNIEKLIIIHDLVEFIKHNHRPFELNVDINKNIHDTGVYLCLGDKLTNIQILNFVKNDKYYLPKSKYLKEPESLKVLGKLDLKKMDEECIKEWKTINWVEIFEDDYLKFASTIINLVKSMEDFHLLLLLLPLKNLNNKQMIINLINILQNTYIKIFKNSQTIKEDYPHFIDDSIELIYMTDKNKNDIKSFSIKLDYKLPSDLIIEIYMKYLTKNKRMSEILETIIVDYLLNKRTDKNEKIKSFLLIFLLERCPHSKDIIVSHFKDYKLNEKELFLINETENIKLVQGLISNDLFDSKDESLINYINYNKNLFANLREKVEYNNITYTEIKPFFDDKETELILKKRLLIIYLNNYQKEEETFQLLSNNFKQTKEMINNIETIIQDENFFFVNKKNININEANNLIKKIKNSNITFFVNNQEIEGYLQYIDDAKERTPKRNSIIYNKIFEIARKTYQNDDQECVTESDSMLNDFKPYLLNLNLNLNQIPENLSNIIKSLKLNEEIINKEVDYLMTIFNYEGKLYRNKLTNSILCLYSREKILKILSSLKRIIDITKVKKESFSKMIDTIIKNMQNQEIIYTIQLSIKILKTFSIDIFDENDNFIKLLIFLYDHSELIEILFDINIENYEKIKNKLNSDFNEAIFNFFKIIEDKDEMTKMKDKELIKSLKKQIYTNTGIITFINNIYNEVLTTLGNLNKIEVN